MIQIDDHDVKEAEQCKILEYLVTQRASADDQHVGGLNLLLVPPWDEAQPAEAIFL